MQITLEQWQALAELIAAAKQAAGDLPRTYEYEGTADRAFKAIERVNKLFTKDNVYISRDGAHGPINIPVNKNTL